MQILNKIDIAASVALVLSAILTINLGVSLFTSDYVLRGSGTIRYGPLTTPPLHTDGKYIKNDLGQIVYLRGVWKAEWADTSTGWWTASGVWPGSMAPGDNYAAWDENVVRAQMQIMSDDWGINFLSTYSWGDWWLQNAAKSISEIVPTTDIGLKDSIKATLRIAQDYGIYFQFRLYSPSQVEGRVEFPYDTGENNFPKQTSKVWKQQDFVNFWADVSAELKSYPNIILTLFDEPVTIYQTAPDPISGKSWFDTVLETVDAMRATSYDGLIMAQWGYCGDNYWMEKFYNYLDSKGRLDALNNLVFSQHIYRYHGTFDGISQSTDYTTMRNYMYANQQPNEPYPATGLHYNRVLNELKLPIIASGGAYGGATDNDEYTAFKNWLLILNELEAGYAGYQWHRSELAWALQIHEPAIQGPNRVGQALIDAIAAGKA